MKRHKQMRDGSIPSNDKLLAAKRQLNERKLAANASKRDGKMLMRVPDPLPRFMQGPALPLGTAARLIESGALLPWWKRAMLRIAVWFRRRMQEW